MTRGQSVKREDLIEALIELAKLLGRTPTTRDIRKKGRYAYSTYHSNFGSFNEALTEAGFDINRRYRISRENLIDEINQLSEEGVPPTCEEMRENGRYSLQPYQRTFGSWNNALIEAGYNPHRKSDSEGIDTSEYNNHDRYGGNWNELAADARERDNYECRDCGMTQVVHFQIHKERLHAHHVVNDNVEKIKLEDLVTLCEDCHHKWEKIGLGPDS